MLRVAVLLSLDSRAGDHAILRKSRFPHVVSSQTLLTGGDFPARWYDRPLDVP